MSTTNTPSDAGSAIVVVMCPGSSSATSRTVTDASITNKAATLTSATANFTSADVNATLTATGIPTGTLIKTVTDSTTITMTKNANQTKTNDTVAIGGETVSYGGTKVFNAGGFNLPTGNNVTVQGSIYQYDTAGYCTR